MKDEPETGLQSAFDALLDSADALTGLDDLVWRSLTEAAESSHHPWYLGVLSTTQALDARQVVPQSRTVVLRHADANARLVECHTDARSGKVSQLNDGETGNQASWLFYDPTSMIQLRITGTTHVINDKEADRAWQSTPLGRRAAYLSIRTPGEAATGSDPPDTSDRQTNLEDSERGREHFRIVRTRVDKIDWLYLRRSGHVRAMISYPTDAVARTKWVVP